MGLSLVEVPPHLRALVVAAAEEAVEVVMEGRGCWEEAESSATDWRLQRRIRIFPQPLRQMLAQSCSMNT